MSSSPSSYTIRVRVIQTKATAWFNIVEKTVWKYSNGGTWAESDHCGEHILTMGDSGTSGTLRFLNPDAGEYFLVALGVHNYKSWSDVAADLSPSNTAVDIHPTYYSLGSGDMAPKRDDDLAPERTSLKGTKVRVSFYEDNGHDLRATITIAA